MVTTLTEVRQHRVLGILGDDRQQTLRHSLASLPPAVQAQVREVAIDMTEKVRRVVEQVLHLRS